MNNALRRICMTGAVAALALTGAARSATEGVEPPLLEGELYITTLNGCGYIIPAASIKHAPGGTVAGMLQQSKSLGWREPPCVEGLLHGEGSFPSSYDGSLTYYTYAYGRALSGSRTTDAANAPRDRVHLSNCGSSTCSGYVSAIRLGPDYTPFWDMTDTLLGDASLTVKEKDIMTTVGTDQRLCKDSVTPVKKCSDKNNFKAFGVYENSSRDVGDHKYTDIYSRFTACPNPLTPVGCEALWRQIAGPTIAVSEAIIAAAKAERDAEIAKLAALTNPWIARRGEIYRSYATRAAQQQAAQIAASLAAADQRSQAAEQAAADFRKTLNAGNAGQLFALADELASSGESVKAREAFRSLVSRFPDHGLASTAAMRLSGLGGSASGSAAGSAPKASARYSSVCVRNLQKVEQALVKANNKRAPLPNDGYMVELNELSARLFQPCMAYDSEAATNYQRASAEAARIRQFCASAHAKFECRPWGVEPYAAGNQRWYGVWHAEMQRALSDPNYSADLGTAKGPGGTVVGAAVQTASGPGAWDPDAHERCRSELHRLGKEFDGHRARIPADQTVPLMELILWYNDTAWVAIDKSCPGAEAFKAEQASYQTTYKATFKACNQISTRTCGPRLPN